MCVHASRVSAAVGLLTIHAAVWREDDGNADDRNADDRNADGNADDSGADGNADGNADGGGWLRHCGARPLCGWLTFAELGREGARAEYGR